MNNAESAANRAALPTPPFDPSQIVLHLGRAARAVRTVRGPDGRIIQELLFDETFSGLLLELPPDEGRCRDCGTVLDHAYSTSRQETYGTTPTRCASCKAAQQKRHAAVATGAACTTGEVAGTTNRGAAAAAPRFVVPATSPVVQAAPVATAAWRFCCAALQEAQRVGVVPYVSWREVEYA